jgi:hypothetical protein
MAKEKTRPTGPGTHKSVPTDQPKPVRPQTPPDRIEKGGKSVPLKN